jgi:hypothetical protein
MKEKRVLKKEVKEHPEEGCQIRRKNVKGVPACGRRSFCGEEWGQRGRLRAKNRKNKTKRNNVSSMAEKSLK